MRTLTVLFRSLFLALFLLAMQAPIAFGQQNRCGKYELWLDTTMKYPDGTQLPVAHCSKKVWFVRHTEGGGWNSLITIYNPHPSSKGMQVYLEFLSDDGLPIAVNIQWLGGLIESATSRDLPLFNGYNDFRITSPNGSTAQAGPISGRVLYDGVDVDTVLDQIKAPYGQLTYEYTPPSGVTTWQVTVPMYLDTDASQGWVCSFTETPNAGQNVATANVTAFSILSLGTYQSVQASVTASVVPRPLPIDQFVLSGIPTGGTRADVLYKYVHTDLATVVAGDGVVHGQIVFQSIGGGKILPLSLRAIGNSLSSNSCFPQ